MWQDYKVNLTEVRSATGNVHAKRLPAPGSRLSLLLALSLTVPLSAQTITKETLANLTFRTIGPVTMSGRIVDIAVNELDPYTMYVAAATGGVWKSTNNGVKWDPVFENESTHSVGWSGRIAAYRPTDRTGHGTGGRGGRHDSRQ